ncbi:hypothetical protein quinque_006012 [Culex quinquefasciatus]
MKSDLNSQFGRDSYEEYSHAEVDNAKRGLPLTVANYKLRLGILNKLEYEHVAKEFRDCFVLCPKLVPMPEQVMGFKYQISKQQLGHCTGRVKEGVGVRVSIACHNGDTKELSGVVDGVDAANVIIYMVKEFEYYNVIRLDFFAQRSTFQMEYQALEMLKQSVIEKVFFADSYTGNESLNFPGSSGSVRASHPIRSKPRRFGTLSIKPRSRRLTCCLVHPERGKRPRWRKPSVKSTNFDPR